MLQVVYSALVSDAEAAPEWPQKESKSSVHAKLDPGGGGDGDDGI